MTLFIYGMNMVFNFYTRVLVDRLSLHYEPNYLRAIFVTILFLFVCHYLYQILNQNVTTQVVARQCTAPCMKACGSAILGVWPR